MLTDHHLPRKKPSGRVRMDPNHSVLSRDLEEISFLRLPDVKLVTGLSKTSLYALIRANSFPAPVRLGPRTVAWVRSEIREWAAERVLQSKIHRFNSRQQKGAAARSSGGVGPLQEMGLGGQCSPALSKLRIQIVGPPLHHHRALF